MSQAPFDCTAVCSDVSVLAYPIKPSHLSVYAGDFENIGADSLRMVFSLIQRQRYTKNEQFKAKIPDTHTVLIFFIETITLILLEYRAQ